MKEMVKYKKRAVTDYLIPKMSFLIGMGSVFNIGGSYYRYNTSKTPQKADQKAFTNDWRMVSQDLFDAFKSLEEERNIRKHNKENKEEKEIEKILESKT